MKNSLGRKIPKGYPLFESSKAFENKKRVLIPEVKTKNREKLVKSYSEVFDKLGIKDGMTLSFHHHLRNGDQVLNACMEEVKRRNLKNLTIASSAIFPNNEILVELIRNKNVTNIYTNYLNGPVAEAISHGELEGILIMQTHGGRARSIEAGELKIDVAFIATPAATKEGDGSGVDGKNPCGVLGYPIPDMLYAKKKVVVTDTLVDKLTITDIKKEYIDYVLIVDSIGDSKGIVSGTTQVTFDPIGLKIAKDATQLLYELGVIKNGFSMQTGAGGTSLAVASFVREKMLQEGIKGKMASGGITSYFVSMLEEGLIEEIRDVQCFDLEAIQSYKKNEKHYLMSASKYANPYDEPVVNDLSFMILGATEIDLDFNVNVTTSSNGVIMGGSGGHSDAAYGAEVALVVAKTMNARIPIIKKAVTTITTPGSDIDCLVTERGIAINPKRKDLLEKLKNSKLNIVSIEELMNLTYQFTREPKPFEHKDRVVGLVEYRDGTIIDVLYQV